MSKHLEKLLCAIFLLSLLSSCNTGEDTNPDSESGEFPSYGTMQARIDGEVTKLYAKKAKQFSSSYLQIVGTNCNKGILVGFDIPFAIGNYSLNDLGDVFIFLQSASACPDAQGGNTPQIIQSAEVNITEFSDTRVGGSFTIIAAEGEITTVEITNGSFSVERE